jgi:hypothetical protein
MNIRDLLATLDAKQAPKAQAPKAQAPKALRVPTSRLSLPVLKLLLGEKTDTLPKTKSAIVDALGWFQVHDVDAADLVRLQQKSRSTR